MNGRITENDMQHSASQSESTELDTNNSVPSATNANGEGDADSMVSGGTSLAQVLRTQILAALAAPGAPLRRFVDGLMRLRTQLENATAPGTELRAKIDALPSIFERWQQLPPQLHGALNAADFPPCHRFSTRDIMEIAETYTNCGSNASTPLIEALARAAFGDAAYRTQMLADWDANPKMGKRMNILRAATEAVVEGRFELAIPALLAQLEGLVADLVAHKGQMNGTKYGEYIHDLQQPDPLFAGVLEEFFKRTLLARFEHGLSIKSTMSRHAILHGGDTSYGTELNAIKAIWMIDYVQAVQRWAE